VCGDGAGHEGVHAEVVDVWTIVGVWIVGDALLDATKEVDEPGVCFFDGVALLDDDGDGQETGWQ